MAKVKLKYDPDNLNYRVKSKSLTGALQRATLLIEALGEDRVNHVDVFSPDHMSKKYEIYVHIK